MSPLPLIDALTPRGLLIFCDGGLANRLNSLIGGLVLAERLGWPHHILWPRNNRCGAALDEVLTGVGPSSDIALQNMVPRQDLLRLWLHENDVGFTQPVTTLHRLDAAGAQALLQQAQDPADQRPVLYAENSVLPWLPDADVLRAVLKLQFAEPVMAKARAILAQHGAQGYVGIHLRGTDFGSPPPTEAMHQAVCRHRGTRFFVCSDDPALEARFAQEPNVFTHDKSATVEKLTEGAWRQPVTDSDGLPYGSNIDRTADSVVQAAVDLLLLAASTPVLTSRSTFLAAAERLRRTGWVARHLWLSPHVGLVDRADDLPSPVPLPDETVNPESALRPADEAPAAPPPPPRQPEFTSQQEVLDLLALLRPQQMITDHKVRVGGDADGGYVMPSLTLKADLVLSIGIGDQVSFDAELAERGAVVHQYDHTIPGQPMAHANFRFNSLGWGPRDEGPLRSLHSMVQAMDWDASRHAVLKFDTEGAEWEALAATTSADLAKFSVIAGEFHYFHSLGLRGFYDVVRHVMLKLHRTHAPVHLHANNATGVRLVQGVPVPPLMELTWVRRDLVVTAGWCTDPIPGPLDRPNMADRPDLCLRPF